MRKYFGFFGVLSISAAVMAQDLTVAEQIEEAIQQRLTVWVRPDGERIYVAHCRSAREGCERRIHKYAEMFVEAANETGVDPWLLVAIAVRESGMHPYAVGHIGETGVMQLHPRSRWGREAKKKCNARPRRCDYAVILGAASVLSYVINRCDSLEDALGAYNTGRCGSTGYSRRVLETKNELIERTGN